MALPWSWNYLLSSIREASLGLLYAHLQIWGAIAELLVVTARTGSNFSETGRFCAAQAEIRHLVGDAQSVSLVETTVGNETQGSSACFNF